jgi:hypothetical protein
MQIFAKNGRHNLYLHAQISLHRNFQNFFTAGEISYKCIVKTTFSKRRNSHRECSNIMKFRYVDQLEHENFKS